MVYIIINNKNKGDNMNIFKELRGKKAIVRSRVEGVNAGIIVNASNDGIILKDVRRLWKHRPADESASWYEGVAKTGIDPSSKVSITVKKKIIVEDYSVTICTDAAFESIMSLTPMPQS